MRVRCRCAVSACLKAAPPFSDQGVAAVWKRGGEVSATCGENCGGQESKVPSTLAVASSIDSPNYLKEHSMATFNDSARTGAQRSDPGPITVSAARGFRALDWIAMILMIVGGLNWGAIGLFGVDVVASLFGPMSILSRAIYALVGLASLYGIAMAIKFGSSRRDI
jgi:uncharacterized membrane protein YuzA (DUF378 family)